MAAGSASKTYDIQWSLTNDLWAESASAVFKQAKNVGQSQTLPSRNGMASPLVQEYCLSYASRITRARRSEPTPRSNSISLFSLRTRANSICPIDPFIRSRPSSTTGTTIDLSFFRTSWHGRAWENFRRSFTTVSISTKIAPCSQYYFQRYLPSSICTKAPLFNWYSHKFDTGSGTCQPNDRGTAQHGSPQNPEIDRRCPSDVVHSLSLSVTFWTNANMPRLDSTYVCMNNPVESPFANHTYWILKVGCASRFFNRRGSVSTWNFI